MLQSSLHPRLAAWNKKITVTIAKLVDKDCFFGIVFAVGDTEGI